MDIKKYVDDGGGHCPFCGSKNVEVDNIWDNMDSSRTCQDCGKAWYNEYTLSGITEED